MKFFLFIISCLSIIFACSTSENFTEAITESKEIDNDTIPKIVFLTYAVKIEQDSSITISLKDKIITQGKLKERVPLSEPNEVGNLKILLQDDKEEIINSFIQKNPLIRDVEYIDDDGKFIRKTIFLDSNDFSIRFQLEKRISKITVEKIDFNINKNILLYKNKL